MSSNQNNAILNALSTQALAKLAGAGGYSDFDTSTLKPTGRSGWGTALRYLGAVAPALAGARQNGIIPAFLSALGGIGEVKNQSAYNQYLQKQALYEMQQQQQANMNNAGLYTDATGKTIANPSAGFNTTFAGGLVGDIRKNNANADIQNLLETGQLQMTNPNADYGDFPKMALERSNQLNDANETLRRMPAFMGVPTPGMEVKQIVDTPAGQMAMQNDGLLQGGISKQQMITPSEAFTYGVPNVGQLLTGRQNEQTDRRGNRTIDETIRSNKVDEGLKKDLYKSQQAENYSSADLKRRTNPNLRSGGGSENPYTIPNAQQNFIEGQVKAIDNELKSLGFIGKNGAIIDPKLGNYTTESKWFDGKSATTPAELAKRQRAAMLIEKRSQLNSAIAGSVPFGGQAASNLNNTGNQVSGFAAWKNSKR